MDNPDMSPESAAETKQLVALGALELGLPVYGDPFVLLSRQPFVHRGHVALHAGSVGEQLLAAWFGARDVLSTGPPVLEVSLAGLEGGFAHLATVRFCVFVHSSDMDAQALGT